MTPQQHYDEAERLLTGYWVAGLKCEPTAPDVARAQVHATLALFTPDEMAVAS